MRILFLSAWLPLPADNGSKLRIWALLRALSRYHQVDLLTFAPAPVPEEVTTALRQACRAVECVLESPFAWRNRVGLRELLSARPRSEVASFSPAMASAVGRRAGAGYDLVIASQLQMAPYALFVPQVPRLLEEVELGLLHDQLRSRQPLRRLRFQLTWWKARRRLAELLAHFTAATVASECERALLEPLAPPNLIVATVPNGVDLEHNSGSFGEPEPDLLVYPGAPSYEPNFEAVTHFARAILPTVRAGRPGARLRVTGEASAAKAAALQAEPGVELTGYLEDIRPTVARAWGEVVPLRRGGGTRLKVLEALALGTPVVSTPKGVEGLDLEPEQQVLVANTDLAFAQAVIRLLSDPTLRARLSAAGRQVVRERYDWQTLGERLHQLVLEVETGSRRAGGRYAR